MGDECFVIPRKEMENISKCFLILEEVTFSNKSKDDRVYNVQTNLDIIQKYLKVKSADIVELEVLQRFNLPTISAPTIAWEYTCYLLYVLVSIKDQINFESTAKEDLISIRHLNLYVDAVCELSCYGIRTNLPPNLKAHPVFCMQDKVVPEDQPYEEEKLKAILRFIAEILQIKTISSSNAIDSVILESMCALYLVISTPQPDLDFFKETLNNLQKQTSKQKYFKNLLILKSISQFPPTAQEQLHLDLMKTLGEPGGFGVLVQNMIAPAKRDLPDWKRFKVVSNIIAKKGHPYEFHKSIIDQIFEFFQVSMQDEHLDPLVPAGVVTLRDLYFLNERLKQDITKRFYNYLDALHQPEDLLTGAILMEAEEFKFVLNLFFTCFCGSSFEVLPSEILKTYIPLLISLYSQIPDKCHENGQAKSLIVQCLANRQKEELKMIIAKILDESEDQIVLKGLHARVVVNFNDKLGLTAQVVPEESRCSVEMQNALPRILKASNNNILIYNIFICVLDLLDNLDLDTIEEPHKIDLIQEQEEFDQFISHKFLRKMNIVSCLTDLISFKPFQSQFHENPREILNFIRNFLQKRISKGAFNGESGHVLSVVLAIFQEILENSTDTSQYRNFCGILKEFLKQVDDVATKHQLGCLISLIEGGHSNPGIGESKYNFARSLLEETQPHLRVYGMTQLIKLLNDKDKETLSNRHAILAIALNALRDQESYAYLNSVRLLVCLVNVLEAEVLETLSAEYLNEDESLDFRLKIGEAMLKVTNELGQLSYKYKDILTNCFLYGCKNKINEFRASSFSNLATLCRHLSFQVHNFFQELMGMIGDALQNETYVPVRRAAVHVLSQLLWGMDNIADFQENLLPIYRILKFTVENEKDEVTRVHATNGLRALSEKCKAFLFPEQKLEMEIKILGINDKDKKKKKCNILEIN